MPDSILTPKLFKFLRELKRNNDRDWFAENKPRYEADVREPAVELVRQLEKPLAKAAPMLGVVAKGHGGSVMRIYRDTRFSKDKTPYKTNVGISVRHQADNDIHAPGVYIHLAADECFIGAGGWRPERKTLAAFRQAIADDPKGWIRARDNRAFRSVFELSGESLKTSPRDYPRDHPMIEDLRRIDFIAVAPLKQSDLTSPDAIKILVDHIKKAKSLMTFLCDAVDVPY
ncbi:hypothetical protein LF1_03760 [Rubripirellula obstinata]|uniref:TIGR02453 family protein n=1 Tax=Rubripirellula obstinata TaxID=406547 RepID=A0A5B1CBF1_9BACT|nr:DUF2461 domain-containing protein [Rubripirellula obstinata]KAA1257886.1 hypothetical protein LF1_03760 [Rubripirellula obstinata]